MNNPFVGFGRPIVDFTRLVGRNGNIKKMVRNLLAGAHMSISGLRRIGKTSLAKHVCKKISDTNKDIRCVEISMNTVNSELEFYRTLSKNLWRDDTALYNFTGDEHSFYLQIVDKLETDGINTIIMLDELDHIRNIANSNTIVNRIREIAGNHHCRVTFLFISARSLHCLEDNTGNVSNLHGICTSSHLKPLLREDGLKQMLQRFSVDDEEILNVLFQMTGGHPFLAEILLYYAIDLANEEDDKFRVDYLKRAIELDECASEFVQYYDQLEKFISSWDQEDRNGNKINAFDELMDIVVGPKLKETDVRLNSFFIDYGLITKNGTCMSEHFRDYLIYKRRQKPFEPLLDDLERSLRDLIKRVFINKKGNNWVDELSKEDNFYKQVFGDLSEIMHKEQQRWKLGCSSDILEYSYPGTLKDIIYHKWNWFQYAVGDSQTYFCNWMDTIAKIRNPIKHNRSLELIPQEEYEKAKRACEELLKRLRQCQ